MKIFLTNTLGGKKEEFVPIRKGRVGIYHCGPTVYSEQHLGNLTGFIYTDVLRRLFEYAGNRVTQVINITDVGHIVDDADIGEDKMEKAAKKTGLKAADIARDITEKYLSDLKAVNIPIEKIKFPRASEHIAEQIDIIKILEKNLLTYRTSDGIYFDTGRFPAYGRLGNINIEGLREGARVESTGEKRNPTDFALWKFSDPKEKRQQEWPSPWGVGFPGWHIECSAMARKYLGETFDIHIGGIEHIPVHHNNEIAQSEGAYGKPLAKYWLHNNHLQLNGQKLSKSDGNVAFLRELLAKDIPAYVFRYWILTAHYKAEKNFTWEAIGAAQSAVEKMVSFVQKTKSGWFYNPVHKETMQKFTEAVSDDIGTPRAIAILWEMMKNSAITDTMKKATLLEADKILGIGFKKITKVEVKKMDVIPTEITALAEAREVARKNKDFKKADELRRELLGKGFDILDTPKGFEIKQK